MAPALRLLKESKVRTARLYETRRDTPAKKPDPVATRLRALRRTSASPSCLPASHQRLSHEHVSHGSPREAEKRPPSVGALSGALSSRDFWRIQRQVMMRTFLFSVKKMQDRARGSAPRYFDSTTIFAGALAAFAFFGMALAAAARRAASNPSDAQWRSSSALSWATAGNRQ
jgi:hypothetical protein